MRCYYEVTGYSSRTLTTPKQFILVARLGYAGASGRLIGPEDVVASHPVKVKIQKDLQIFPLDKSNKKLEKGLAPAPAFPYQPALKIKEMSFLHWVEHCVECAAPGCYQSCDLYQARFDLRCRRFAFGVRKNKNFSALRGYGVEISFKKWAKLEAYGNLNLMPVWVVRWIERLALSSAPFGDSIGAILAKMTGKPRWFSATHIGFEKLVRRFARPKQDSGLPHAFVLEAYNPDAETVHMQVCFAPVRDENIAKSLIQLAPSFIKTLGFPGGYSRHVIKVSDFRSVIETGRAFLISMIPEADKNARLVFQTADLVQFDREPETAKEEKKIKCIVWDLDNTLWDGVLSEGDEITIKPEMLSLLEHLDSRGILMSIASKNDHAAALAKLEELGVADYFLYPQINWGLKSQSIKKIAERLNIGLDTLGFVDDNSFELGQVASVLPTVTCIDTASVSSLQTNKTFEGSTSADSRQRRKFYRDAIERETEQEKFGRDYMAFLASCNIELELNRYSVADSERVAELVQRTNQLNFSGRKYTRREMDEILLNSTNEKVVLKCSDRYGSYGTVGFGLIQTEDGVIRVYDFMLSCRVQGKLIEQAFFNHLFEHHNPQGSTALWVNFRATERNKPAEQVLESLGFRKCDPATDRLSSGLILSTPETLQCRTILVRCSPPTLSVGPTLMAAAQDLGVSQFSAENGQM